MKKRYIIIPLIITGLILLVSPFIFRVNAAAARYRVDPSSSDNVYIYYNMFYLQGVPSYDLVVDDENNRINVVYDSNNNYFVVNNNTNNILLPNHLYVIVFQNGINHYIFYEIQKINDNDIIDNVNDLEIIELFTISFSSRVVNYYYVYSQGMQFMFSNNPALDTSQIVNSWYIRYNNTFYGRNATQSYNRGYNKGYNDGYNSGYNEGESGENAISPFVNIVTSVFNGIDSVLQIEMIPHIKLWYFIAIPLTFVVLWGVFKIFKSH